MQLRQPRSPPLHRSLGGPGGRHETDTPRHIGIWKFSKNVPAAKEWIRYLLGKKEVYDEYIMSGDAFNLPPYANLVDHPVLKTDPKFVDTVAVHYKSPPVITDITLLFEAFEFFGHRFPRQP